MRTVGQVNSLSTGGGGFSPTACDFEPNSWPNRSPIEGLESDEAPNRLPPPQPDSRAPVMARARAARRWPARPAAIVRSISLSRIIQMSPRCPGILAGVIAAQWRRTQGAERAACHNLKTGLAAKILMQEAEQQMVLPDAVDAEIAPRQPL